MPEKFDVVLALRQATRDLHGQLEDSSVFSCLMKQDVTLRDYIEALRVLHRIYVAVEPELIRGLKFIDGDYCYLPRLPLLRKDLECLQVPLAADDARLVVQPADNARTLALLYVVEGSALGGQLLLRQLQSALGASVQGALAFYGLGGSLNGQHWRRAQILLRSQLKTQAESMLTIAATRKVFELFIEQRIKP
jgi:heme oxygenase